MSQLLLGIDIGTSAVKAGIFDPSGEMLGQGRMPHVVNSPHAGWAECDPEDWWQGACLAIRCACDAARVSAVDIGAVGLSVMFPCVMPLSGTGQSLYPAILYSDRRSMKQVRMLEQRVGRLDYEKRIRNTLVPGTCAATSIAWLRDCQPSIYQQAATIGWANTFFTVRFTGSPSVDPSMVALSGLADPATPEQWSAELCDIWELDPGKLPPIRQASAVAGEVTRAASAATGLRAGIPVICGAGDVPVSVLGAGVLDEQCAVYVAGSTDCVALPLPEPGNDRRWVNCASVQQNRWLGIGTTTSSGVSVDWFIQNMLNGMKEGGHARMTAMAAACRPQDCRTLYLPYLQGERTPVWDPQARGVLMGLTDQTEREQLARAVFEGTAFALREIFETFTDSGCREMERVRTVGGATSNRLWNQIKADILQKPLEVLAFQETGILGAALMAGVGNGTYASLAEAARIAAGSNDANVIYPNVELQDFYAIRFDLYRQIYRNTRDIIHALAAPPA